MLKQGLAKALFRKLMDALLGIHPEEKKEIPPGHF